MMVIFSKADIRHNNGILQSLRNGEASCHGDLPSGSSPDQRHSKGVIRMKYSGMNNDSSNVFRYEHCASSILFRFLSERLLFQFSESGSLLSLFLKDMKAMFVWNKGGYYNYFFAVVKSFLSIWGKPQLPGYRSRLNRTA